MIILINKQDELNDIYHNWVEQYPKDKQDIANKLKALTSPVKAEDIDVIIGNSSWTRFNCDICDTSVEHLVFLEPKAYCPYENPGIQVCKKCLQKAIDIID